MNGRKDHSPHWHWLGRGIIVNCKSENIVSTVEQRSNCRDRLPKRCRCSNGDRFGRPTATYSRLAWTVHGRTGMEEGELGLSGSAGEQFPKHLLHLFQRDPRTNLDSNTIYLLIFRRTPIATCANAQKHESSMQEESSKSRRQDTRSNNIWTYNYSGSPSSQWREGTSSIAPSICGSGTGFGQPMDTD